MQTPLLAAAAIAFALLLSGCSRGPTYAEALKVYEAEQAELARMTRYRDGAKVPWETEMALERKLAVAELSNKTTGERRILTPIEIDGLMAARVRTHPKLKAKIDAHEEIMASMEKQIAEQIGRVDAARRAMDALAPK